MKIYDVLYSMNTRNATPKARPFDNLLGQALGGEGVITTATGNPVSIVTNKSQNAISTLLSYSPKQSGTGDPSPSPSNVRPIEGWTEANLNVAGKNLYNDSTSTDGKYINDSGTLSTSAWYLASDYIPVARNGVYITSGFIGSGTVAKHAFYDANKNFISVVNATQNPITMPDNCAFVRLSIRTTGMTNVQFEAGSQATDYAPFIAPSTITESLGGTYYGFTVDVERGVMRVTHEVFIADGTEEVVNVNVYNGVYYVIMTTSLGAKNAVCISDKFKYKVAIEAGCTYIGGNGQSLVCALLDQTINTKEDAKQWFLDNPTKWAYELATPIELPITPQTVALLAGNNTLWCDGDSLSVTYKARG